MSRLAAPNCSAMIVSSMGLPSSPPASAGNGRPIQPIAAMALNSSAGYAAASSHAFACDGGAVPLDELTGDVLQRSVLWGETKVHHDLLALG